MPESTLGSVKKKRGIPFLTILIVLFFVTAASLAGIFVYVYFIRINKVENILTNVTNIELTDKSNIDAERMNLDEDVKPKPKDVNVLVKTEDISLATFSSDYQKYYLPAFEVEKDLTLKSIITTDLTSKSDSVKNKGKLIAIVNLQKDTIIDNEDTFSQSILATLKGNFDGIELSPDFLLLENYRKIVTSLNNSLNSQNKTLTLGILPRWGNTIDYNFMDNFALYYRKSLDYKFLSSNSNEIKIYAYNFTTPQSSLIGQIAPSSWVKQVIQYYIKEGIDRTKINLTINSRGYVWRDREIAQSQSENYVTLTTQVIYLPSKDISDMITNNKLTMINEDNWTDSIGQFTKDDQKFVVVYSTADSLNQLINLTAEYGLSGYCLN